MESLLAEARIPKIAACGVKLVNSTIVKALEPKTYIH